MDRLEKDDFIKIIKDLTERIEALERRQFNVIKGTVIIRPDDNGNLPRIIINDGNNDRGIFGEI